VLAERTDNGCCKLLGGWMFEQHNVYTPVAIVIVHVLWALMLRLLPSCPCFRLRLVVWHH
jgi:hypothetical protein